MHMSSGISNMLVRRVAILLKCQFGIEIAEGWQGDGRAVVSQTSKVARQSEISMVGSAGTASIGRLSHLRFCGSSPERR